MHDTHAAHHARHRALKVAILAAAAAWAAALMVTGFGLILDALGPQSIGSWGFSAGLAALAAGQFVLMSIVADRILPVSPRWPVALAQAAAAGIFAVSFTATAAAIFGVSA